MKNRWRFIYSGFCPADFNMAVDETLFESCRKTGIPAFRIYGWRPHAFSIGCSQKRSEVLFEEKCIQDNIPIVERLTGGGIIFHGDEVTYSIACSQREIGEIRSVKGGYKLLCSFLLNAYREYGLEPLFAIDLPNRSRDKSSFCFSSFEDYDIVVKGRKIGGNAQKRRRQDILQHGSIPLSLNYAKVRLYVREPIHFANERSTSLKDLLENDISFEDFA